jgi:PAS domain S-box-containing protein
MTLRKKTLLIIGLMLIGLIAMLYAVSQTVFLDSFSKLEEQDTSQNVERALGALSDDISRLTSTVSDWAPWDDTYNFVEDLDESYVQNNLNDATIANLGINFVLFVNSSGQLVYGKAFDLQNEEEIPVPQGLQEYISASDHLASKFVAESSISGIILSSEGPMLIASHQIMTSEHKGPIRGALIMGRYLDSAEIESLAETTHLSLSVHRLDDTQMPADFEAARSVLTENEAIFVRPLDSNSVAGYALIKDIDGAPVLVLRADMPRGIYQQGQTSLLYFISLLVVVSLLFVVVVVVLLERFVLSRLSRLNASVRDIGTREDLSAQVAVRGRDEVSSLGGEINKMLRVLRQSHEAQRESELVATATIEGMADGVMLVNMEGKVTYVNKAFEKLLGHKAEEIVGTSALELPTYRGSKDRERAREALKMLIEKGSAKAVDMTAITKDGEEIPISFNASLIKDAQGNPKILVAVLRDVTERRWAEEALRQSEEYFRALTENASDGVVVWDRGGTVRYESPSMERMLGRKPGEEVGKSLFEFAHPDDAAKIAESLAELVQSPGHTLHTEIRMLHEDGSWRIFEGVCKNLLDNPFVEGLVINARDITERRKMESELRLLSDAVKMSKDSIVISDLEGIIIEANEATLKMHGMENRADLVGRRALELIAPEDREMVAGKVIEALAAGGRISIEYHCIANDGRKFLIEASISVMKDGNGEPTGYMAVSRDITERRKMEEEVRLLSDAVKMSTDSVAVADMRGRILDINEAGLRMYGLSDRADFVGKNPLDAIAPEDRSKAIENMAKLVETGQVNNIEYHVLRKDGSRILIETSVSVIKGGNGEPKGLVAVARDITERKRMEEALRESEHKFRAIFDNANEGFISVDPESGRFFNPNRKMIEMLGYDSEEEIANLTVSDIHPKQDLPDILKEFGRHARREISRSENMPVQRKDGSVFYASISSSPITIADKMYLSCIFTDTTERKRMEEALRRSEEYFRSLIENAQDAVVIVAGDGTISYGSPSIERMLGYKPEELISADALFSFAHPDDIPKVVDTFTNFAENGNASECIELRIRHKDGSWRVVEAVANNLLENRAIKGIVVNWRDVTERKKAEEFLRESEERFRAIFDNSIDGILVTDLETKSLYTCNKAMCQMLGYNLEEIGNLKVTDIHPKKDLPYVMTEIERERRGESSGVKILPLERKDGSVLYAEVTPSLVTFAGRQYLAGIFRDISERKQAEDALKLSEERYRLVVENASEAILVAQDGMVRFFNTRVIEIFGYSREELASKPFVEFIHSEDQAMVAGRYMARLEGKEVPPVYSFRVVGKTGNVRWVEISAVVFTWEGKPATLNFLTDITERKRMEEEKQKMEEQLRLAGRLAAVGELAAGVAHELNNPLAAIQGYSQFLSSSNNLDEATKKDVETIYREALRASKITQNLLSFARRHEPEKRLISLNEVLEKTIELRAHPLKVGNIELVTELAPDLPKTMADFYQLQQVFVNIINNAEQAMAAAHGKGKLVIKTEKSNGMIQITFTDDGPGISEENMKRIFDPFFTTKEVGKGTGLGLPICYGIAKAHGGRIYAKSKVGEGATFTVEIPIVSEGQSTQEV